jgi:putative DNA primase/helicase
MKGAPVKVTRLSPDASEVKARAAGRWDRIIASLAPQLAEALEHPGRHVRCPNHGGARDFRVFRDVADTGGGVCTCGTFADGFSLIGWANGWDFHKTVCEVHAFLGGAQISAPIATPCPKKARASKLEDAALKRRLTTIWNAALTLDHPKAEPLRRYFANRGITLTRPVANLRFHPALAYHDEDRVFVGRFPGLIGRVSAPDDTGVTLHRTYLTPDGWKADVPEPKKLMSHPGDRSMKGAAIRLSPDVTGVLAVAEGIETAIAVTLLTRLPCWSAIATVFMGQFEPPAGINQVLVFADKDANGAGEKAARELIARMWQRGMSAGMRLPQLPIPVGKKGIDWLDVLNIRSRRTAA